MPILTEDVLTEFPAAPAGKTGWPWNVVSRAYPFGRAVAGWPRITIITPNYNYAPFLEMSIRSVLLQGYPNLEYIVIDDGSTDGSLDIIRKYEPWISFWKTGPNRGQTRVLNEGFRMATGDIVNWLCSDDYLCPGALRAVARYFRENPGTDAVVGKGRIIHLKYNNKLWIFHPRPLDLVPATIPFAQPSCFYRRELLDRPDPLDESYHYLMDLELWSYFQFRGARWKVVEDTLSVAHYSHTNKTCTGKDKVVEELDRVYRTYTRERVPLTFWHRLLRLPLERFAARYHPVGQYLAAPVWLFWTLVLGCFYGFRRVWIMRWKWVFRSV